MLPSAKTTCILCQLLEGLVSRPYYFNGTYLVVDDVITGPSISAREEGHSTAEGQTANSNISHSSSDNSQVLRLEHGVDIEPPIARAQ